jgi:hypothetical protein
MKVVAPLAWHYNVFVRNLFQSSQQVAANNKVVFRQKNGGGDGLVAIDAMT